MIKEKDLKPINIATIAIGQANAVTPIQLITAVSAVANGGILLEPQIVREEIDTEGNVVKSFAPKPVRRVISEQTAETVREMLEGVVSQGTGRNAYIPGYRVGGKTGTAQKAGPGGYMPGKYVASFMGIAPINDPQIAALVILDEPRGYPNQGGQIAAPVFRAVVEDTLRYLGIVSQYAYEDDKKNDSQVEPKLVSVPEVINLSPEEGTKVLKLAGFQSELKGEGQVVTSQTPAGMAKVKAGTKVVLKLGAQDESLMPGMVTVPDLTGKRIRDVAELLSALGLKLNSEGEGRVQRQEPIPGTVIQGGQEVYVLFAEKEEIAETLGP